MNNPRRDDLDLMKGIGILAVVGIHSLTRFMADPQLRNCPETKSVFGKSVCWLIIWELVPSPGVRHGRLYGRN